MCVCGQVLSQIMNLHSPTYRRGPWSMEEESPLLADQHLPRSILKNQCPRTRFRLFRLMPTILTMYILWYCPSQHQNLMDFVVSLLRI
jgi:hypothetical protein